MHNIKWLTGTFQLGCGILVWDIDSDKMYHLVVVQDRATNKPCVEIEGKVYFKDDLTR